MIDAMLLPRMFRRRRRSWRLSEPTVVEDFPKAIFLRDVNDADGAAVAIIRSGQARQLERRLRVCRHITAIAEDRVLDSRAMFSRRTAISLTSGAFNASTDAKTRRLIGTQSIAGGWNSKLEEHYAAERIGAVSNSAAGKTGSMWARQWYG
ncbi:hypothetical protein BC628DRAFT_1341646 [Trametes gibbosa]|nr:hypothetical protein BC628DRAFT_1341646 [Trametes gibbosa]